MGPHRARFDLVLRPITEQVELQSSATGIMPVVAWDSRLEDRNLQLSAQCNKERLSKHQSRFALLGDV